MKRLLIAIVLIASQVSCIHAQTAKIGGTATVGGQVGIQQVSAVVHLVSITVTPANASANVGDTLGYTAIGHFNDSSTRNLTKVAVWGSSSPSVASLQGLSVTTPPTEGVKCLTGGSTTVSAIRAGITGSTPLTCAAPPTPSGNDLYCGPGNAPSFGTSDGPAALPATCYYTNPSTLPSPGPVRVVTDLASFNAAWAAAACGDIIQQTAGTTITGNLTIPTKTCDAAHYITYRTSGYASLPAYGTKVTPCFAGVASLPGRPNFNCANTNNVMAMINSTSGLGLSKNLAYVHFEGIVFARPTGKFIKQMIAADDSGANHIIFDHDWIQGVPLDDTNTGLYFDRMSWVALVDSFVSDMHCASTCTDAHAWSGGHNNFDSTIDTTWKIVNNYLEGSGQCDLTGGGGALTVPSSIEVRQNWCFKPPTWNPSDPSYSGGNGTRAFIVKNGIEVKNGDRMLFEGNVIEGVWAGFGQNAASFGINPSNQGGNCPICAVTNVTFRYNRIKTSYQMLLPTTVEDATFPAFAGNGWSLHDNLGDNLGYATCNHCGNHTTFEQLVDRTVSKTSLIQHDVSVNHNTAVYVSGGIQPNAILGLAGPAASTGFQSHDITWTNNIGTVHFGIIPTDSNNPANCVYHGNGRRGDLLVPACWASSTFGGNAFVGNGITQWPGTNCTKQSSADFTYSQLFVNYNGGTGGDYHIAATSACRLKGTDGRDPGADVDTVNAKTQGVNSF